VNNSRPKARLSRALGIPLTRKCVKYFERRPFPPGVHGRGRRKASDYQVRLLEKQRLRHQYNVSEAQMRKAYDDAHRGEGKTGENMVALLERRLDATVLRAGLARTIYQALPDRGGRRARRRPDPAVPVHRAGGPAHHGDP
jgi:small subunit ribosomal protein S4